MKIIMFLAATALAACGTIHHTATSQVDIAVREGPPCRVVISVDGAVVATVDGAAGVKCPLPHVGGEE
jgi:hypothetical protein